MRDKRPLSRLSLAVLISISSFAHSQEKPHMNETAEKQNTRTETQQPGGSMPNPRSLKACPSSPNCVISQNPEDKKHYVEALLTNDTSVSEKRSKILSVLAELPRVKIVTDEENYIHAEFTSKLMSYVDDVEFLISEGRVDVRSASRVGYSDLGANRKRIEKIRSKLDQ